MISHFRVLLGDVSWWGPESHFFISGTEQVRWHRAQVEFTITQGIRNPSNTRPQQSYSVHTQKRATTCLDSRRKQCDEDTAVEKNQHSTSIKARSALVTGNFFSALIIIRGQSTNPQRDPIARVRTKFELEPRVKGLLSLPVSPFRCSLCSLA